MQPSQWDKGCVGVEWEQGDTSTHHVPNVLHGTKHGLASHSCILIGPPFPIPLPDRKCLGSPQCAKHCWNGHAEERWQSLGPLRVHADWGLHAQVTKHVSALVRHPPTHSLVLDASEHIHHQSSASAILHRPPLCLAAIVVAGLGT